MCSWLRLGSGHVISVPGTCQPCLGTHVCPCMTPHEEGTCNEEVQPRSHGRNRPRAQKPHHKVPMGDVLLHQEFQLCRLLPGRGLCPPSAAPEWRTPKPAQLQEGARSPPSLRGAPPPAINSLEFTGAFTSFWPCPAFQGLNANHMQRAHPPAPHASRLAPAGRKRALGGEQHADLHARLCTRASLEPPAALTTAWPKLSICST